MGCPTAPPDHTKPGHPADHGPTPAATMHPIEAPNDNFRLLIRQASALCVLVHSLYIALFVWAQVDALAWLNVASVLTHCVAFWLSRTDRHVRAASLVLIAEITVHAIAATVVIGWEAGFHYLMLPVVPVAMLSSSEHRMTKNAIALCLSAIYLGLDGWSDNNPPQYLLDDTVLDLLRYQNIVTLLLAFIVLSRGYYNVVTQAQAALAKEASTDPLTGAVNRRLMDMGRSEMAKQQHGEPPLALLLCDLDHFKRINDTHGHRAGDLVLQDFYRRALGVTRSTDTICRWGGEEFLILLPDTPTTGACDLAERLHQAVVTTPFRVGSGKVLHVTVTIGVATVRAGEDLLDAVHRADAALYQGKQQGRNQVVLGQAPTGQDARPERARSPAMRQD